MIERFKKDPNIKIIMLSSSNAASGINLTEANKILFLETIYGTKEYRKNMEDQCIGRSVRIGQKKPVEIIHFIIKDTIEEDIYDDINIDNNKIKNMLIN